MTKGLDLIVKGQEYKEKRVAKTPWHLWLHVLTMAAKTKRYTYLVDFGPPFFIYSSLLVINRPGVDGAVL